MASITIQKHTSISTKAQGRHNYRENKTNANQHIDPSKTPLNINLDDRYKNSTEMQAAIRERVKEVDKVLPPQRKKKDRIVTVCIEVPAPRANMSYEESVKFLKAANEAINEKFGIENCHGATIHADEQHNYYDPTTKTVKESRVHLHKMVVPFVEGKGVNGKQFVPKKLYNELNKLLDEVCIRELGYTFQDGTRQKSRGRVEDIKADSAIAMQKINRVLKKQNQELEQQNTSLTTKNQELVQQNTDLTEQAKEISISIDDGMKDLEELENKYYEVSQKVKTATDMERLCELVADQPVKEYKKNLTGKYVQVPVEDLEELQQIPQMAKAASQYLAEARTSLKEARKAQGQAEYDRQRAKELAEAHKDYDRKLSNLEAEIDKEADKKATKKVYEILGDKIQQDKHLDAFFREKGLWASFKKFCTELVQKTQQPTRTLSRFYDDYER